MIPRLLLLANTLGIAVYIFWQGMERFWWESYGTWIISPVIYVRLTPQPYKYWLLDALNSGPLLSYFLCFVPVFMGVVALAFGAVGYRRRSLSFAIAACALATTVFVVYHSVKHMGIQYQII